MDALRPMFKVPTPVVGLAFEQDFRTVFDIGGNVGAWAEDAYRHWPNARILSFEPLLDIADENRRRASGRWETYSFGLADDQGPRMIERNLSNPGSSTLSGPGSVRREVFGLDERYEREMISCYPLDMIIVGADIKPPALMKIDVEGAELLVLKGGRRTIPKFDTVVIELNGPGVFENAPSAETVDEFMRDLGFRLLGSLSELRHPEEDTILQWDGVWVRR